MMNEDRGARHTTNCRLIRSNDLGHVLDSSSSCESVNKQIGCHSTDDVNEHRRRESAPQLLQLVRKLKRWKEKIER